MSNCKDALGNSLEVGHMVSIVPPINILHIAKIVEIKEGGIAIAIDRNHKGSTPATVRILLDVTIQANPGMPIFPNLVRIVTPQSEAVVEKAMGEPDEPPPSGKVSLQ